MRNILYIFHIFICCIQFYNSQVLDLQILTFFFDYKTPYEHKITLSPILKKLNIDYLYQSYENFGCSDIIPTDFLKIRINSKDEQDFTSILLSKFSKLIKTIIKDRKIINILKESKSFLPLNSASVLKSTYQYQFALNSYKSLKIDEIQEKFNTKGRNTRIAIFDTGVSDFYQTKYKDRLKTIKNWTSEKYFGNDMNGHGTFIASIFLNSNNECLGIASESDLYIYKVFTKRQESYTSWFLDAFNNAIHEKIDLINFSIGSTDFTEKPFIDKIKEITSKNITIISAIGNDGPYIGTTNNPSDLMEVIGVGGIDTDDETIASFSSRGMTTWELISGNGRVKPDIVTYSKFILGSDIDSDKCIMKTGTSISTAIITASLSLIISFLREKELFSFINPATLKQAVIFSGKKLNEASIFEQGAGFFQLEKIFEFFEKKNNSISFFPEMYNLTHNNYYYLPYSNQPLYKGSMPTIFNITFINGIIGTDFHINKYEWIETNFASNNIEIKLDTNIENNDMFSYFYYFGLFINIKLIKEHLKSPEIITIYGKIRFYLTCKSLSSDNFLNLSLDFNLIFDLIKTPPKNRRLLWDQFHNMKYPESNYIPRDSLSNYDYPYEWHGDHPYTNFFQLFTIIRSLGYFLEILRSPFTCFDASNYAALLIIDSEETFSDNEINKIEYDVLKEGLSLIIFADWFDDLLIEKNIHQDNNKFKGNLKPLVGGANIPALNDLLNRFHIGFGTSSFAGDIKILNKTVSYFSGTYIKKFPKDGFLFTFDIFNESDIILNSKINKESKSKHVPILGLIKNVWGIKNTGKILIYGDSNCIDNSYLVNDCFDLFIDFLKFIDDKEMNIFKEFNNFILPLDYEDFGNVIGMNEWDGKEKFLNFSKTEKNLGKCHDVTLLDKEIIKKINVDDLIKKEKSNLEKINKWITNQKNHSNIDIEMLITSEFIQIVIMIFSLTFVIFFLVIIFKRKKRIKYIAISKDPVMLV